jgi:DNA-binding transcriptional MerR regulator
MSQDPLPRNQASDAQLKQLIEACKSLNTSLTLVGRMIMPWGDGKRADQDLNRVVEELKQTNARFDKLFSDVWGTSMPVHSEQEINEWLRAVLESRAELAAAMSQNKREGKRQLPSEIADTLHQIALANPVHCIGETKYSMRHNR